MLWTPVTALRKPSSNRSAAALHSGAQAALQEIPLYLELSYLLVELGDEGLIAFLLVMVTAEDAGCTFS